MSAVQPESLEQKALKVFVAQRVIAGRKGNKDHQVFADLKANEAYAANKVYGVSKACAEQSVQQEQLALRENAGPQVQPEQ